MTDDLTLLAEATEKCVPCGGTGSIPRIPGLKTQPWMQTSREGYSLPSDGEAMFILLRFAMSKGLWVFFIPLEGIVECKVEGTVEGRQRLEVATAPGELDAFTAALVEVLGLRRSAKELKP